MYTAEYDIGGSRWRQVAARLIPPRGPDEQLVARWWERLQTLVRSLDAVPDSSLSLRVELREHFQATLFAGAPATQAALLLRAFGSFSQLDLLGAAEVEFPQEKSAHDRLLAFPSLRTRVALPRLTSGGAWFAFDFRVSPLLNELMAEARGLGYSLAYHVNVERFQPGADELRQAAHNALRVARLAGVPATLVRLQNRLAENLRSATHLSEEFLGVETEASRAWLAGALARRFGESYGLFVTPEFSFETEAHDGPLTTTRHTACFDPLPIDAVCGAAMSARQRCEILSWRPRAEFIDLMTERPAAPEPVGQPAAVDYSSLPAPYAGRQPFFFISYKREDLARIEPLVTDLGRRGHKVWYDRGIPGGAEWDALIEERIRSCQVLVLFLSQAAVHSKYVRREVKFADTLNKPIVGVNLERNIELSHGMRMLLNQYQCIESSPAGLGTELERTVRFVHLAGGVAASPGSA
jgi:hypothetical protein